MKFSEGQRVVFRTTFDEMHNAYARRWEGMEFVVINDLGGSDDRGGAVYVEIVKRPDFWREKVVYFTRKFLCPVATTPFEADLIAYITAEKKELGL